MEAYEPESKSKELLPTIEAPSTPVLKTSRQKPNAFFKQDSLEDVDEQYKESEFYSPPIISRLKKEDERSSGKDEVIDEI